MPMSPPAMSEAGNSGAAARKDLRVLLPFTCDSLRIPDELAEDIGATEAHIVVPFGKSKLRRVEVGRDDDGAFLGGGWPEFAAACGIGAGWLLVLRHHGRGVLTFKAFDETGCLREIPTRTTAVEATTSSSDTSRRPQFVGVIASDSMEKMKIPAKFVQSHIPKEHLNSHMAVVFGPHSKIGHIVVEMSLSDVFFAGGWSQFLKFHGITGANCLLLRYEGNMVFTVKVFEPNGCQRESKHNDVRFQQNEQNMIAENKLKTPSASIQRCKNKNNRLGNEGCTKPKISKTYLGKLSLSRNSFYRIKPPSWIQKQISPNSLRKCLGLSTKFCNGIGLKEACTITLRTSVDRNASWQVRCWPDKSCYKLLGGGWKKFCKENSLNIGDICTFNVDKTTLWSVVIKRYNEKQDISSSSTTKGKSKNDGTNCEEQIGPERSIRSSTKSSSRKKSYYETEPAAWIKKEMNASTIENAFSLPLTFCKKIGIREPCTVTLKTSTCSTMAWQARAVPYQMIAHLSGLGWKMFCRENGIKVGDICTFNIVEPMLWHVDITRQ